MNPLSFIPGAVWAIALAVAVAANVVTYVRLSHAQQETATCEKNFAQFKTEVAEATTKAEQEAREREHKMAQSVQRITENAQQRETRLASRSATTELVARGLLDDINRLNARAAAENPDAARSADEARRARQLLGACSQAYRGVATAADGLRDQVTGLHEYVTSTVSQR